MEITGVGFFPLGSVISLSSLLWNAVLPFACYSLSLSSTTVRKPGHLNVGFLDCPVLHTVRNCGHQRPGMYTLTLETISVYLKSGIGSTGNTDGCKQYLPCLICIWLVFITFWAVITLLTRETWLYRWNIPNKSRDWQSGFYCSRLWKLV